MPRPQKAKLDYFPLDTDIDQDDKIALIEAKHGIVGFGVIIKLFKKIYATNGYYYEWNEKTQLLFSKAIGVDFEKVIEIVNDALNWKLFDRGLYKKYGILTSNRIQKTYLEATIRRKEVELIKEYLLDGINGYIKRDNVVIYAINTGNNKQSKVKESKVKESKVKYAEFVSMFKEEYQKLVEKFGKENTRRMIEKLDNYKGATGKRYKSDYRAILNWVADKVLGEDKTSFEKVDLRELTENAKKCFMVDHKGSCDNPSYTISGKMLRICEICKDNRAKWRGG